MILKFLLPLTFYTMINASTGHPSHNSRVSMITVTAKNRDYREAPVTVRLDPPVDYASVAVFQKDGVVPAQLRVVDGKAEVSWLVHDLKKGQKLTYRLSFEKRASEVSESGVIVEKTLQGDIDVRINNKLFTRYDTHTGPNKPYFYPIMGANDKQMVRHYPFEKVAGETSDHPHHRGLWFTHGEVNGEDFWSEEKKAAKTVHVKTVETKSGPVFGLIRSETDWIAKTGAKVASDERSVRIYNTRYGRLMDWSITMRATEGELVFGDTKEGSLGLRVPDTMRQKGGDGHIISSSGLTEAATWGKPAEWVDYYGTVEGAISGIAIYDHPSNFRHPTTWHVRDYGLFAANPFGLHDFQNDKLHPTLGEHKVPTGGSLTFRYLIYLHSGTTDEAKVPDVWQAWIDPPLVEVKSS